MARIALAASALAWSACAILPTRWAPLADFKLAVADNPAKRRFDLILTSKATEPLCLSREVLSAEGPVHAPAAEGFTILR